MQTLLLLLAGLTGAGSGMVRSRMVWAVSRGGCPCSGQDPGSRGRPAAGPGVLLCKSVFAQRPAGGEWCRPDGISQGPPVNVCCSRRTSGSSLSGLPGGLEVAESPRLCINGRGEMAKCARWVPAPSLPHCSGVYSRHKTFRIYIFL